MVCFAICTRYCSPVRRTAEFQLHSGLLGFQFWAIQQMFEGRRENQKDCFEATFIKRFIEKTGAVDHVQGYTDIFQERLNELDMLLQLAGQYHRHTEQHADANTFDYQTFSDLSLNPRENISINGSEPLPPPAMPRQWLVVSLHTWRTLNTACCLRTMSTYNFPVVSENDPQGRPFVLQKVEKFRTIEILGQTYRLTLAASPRGANIQVPFWQDDELHAFTSCARQRHCYQPHPKETLLGVCSLAIVPSSVSSSTSPLAVLRNGAARSQMRHPSV